MGCIKEGRYVGKAIYVGQSARFAPGREYSICLNRKNDGDYLAIIGCECRITYSRTNKNENGACKYWKLPDGKEIFEVKMQ